MAMSDSMRAALFWTLLLGCTAWLAVEAIASRQAQLPGITILAEPSMAGAVAVSAVSFSRENKAVASATFAPLADEIKALEEGSAGDVFITDAFNLIQDLKGKGLTDVYSQTIVGRSELVLAIPEDVAAATGITPQSPREDVIAYLQKVPQVGVISSELPDSRYWVPVALALGVEEGLQEKAVPTSGYEVLMRNARERSLPVLAPSHVLSQHKGFATLYRFSAPDYPTFTYYAVVLAGENMETAREYLKFLAGETGRSLLAANGLHVATQ